MKTICILGLGYIGLPTASLFATHGIKVIGVDISPNIVEVLRSGNIHIEENGLKTMVQKALDSGNLVVQGKPAEADAFIIAVPTPFNPDKTADMKAVISATESVMPFLRKGNLVILESTSPPLTTSTLVKPILESTGLKVGSDFLLAYSPERVLPGQILRELVDNARVVGGIDHASAEAVRDLYSAFVKGEIILTDSTTAEMVKLIENTYRDVNIAIANEFSRLADRFQIDVWEAIKIANKHPRVNILYPGPGVGGHCISVDPWFLVEAAPDLTPLIKTARSVNDSQPSFVVRFMEQALGSLKGKRIGALGLSYKPDVDDLRESPAIDVIHLLQKEGAEILAYEPYTSNIKLDDIKTVSTLEGVLQGRDIILVLVNHTQFHDISPTLISQTSPAKIIFDAAGCWEMSDWVNTGFKYFKLGVNKQNIS